MKNFIMVAVALVTFHTLILIGWNVSNHYIATHCEKTGRFLIEEKVYMCQKGENDG